MATGTLVDVVMPQMGVSVSEGTITRWAKNVGETIEADETIVEISTDKVDTEVPAPATGVVRELLAAEGETVPVNTRIAVIDTGGGGADQTEPGPDAAVVVAEGEATEGSDPQVAPSPPPPAQQSVPDPGSGQGEPSSGNGHGGEGRTFVSPVVARMVAEHNLDINAISGTGAGGRVTKKDVQAFIDSGGKAAAPAPRRRRSPRCTTCRTSRLPPSPRHRRRAGRRAGRRAAPAAGPAAAGGARDRRGRARPGRGALPLQHRPQGHRPAHAPLARDRRPGDDGDRGRHDRRGQPAQEVEADLRRAPRREPHLRPVRRPRDDGRDRPLAVGELRGARRDPR